MHCQIASSVTSMLIRSRYLITLLKNGKAHNMRLKIFVVMT